MWKLVALQFVLLVCLTSAKLCKEEKEDEVIKSELAELEHECEDKSAEALECVTNLKTRFAQLSKHTDDLSKMSKVYDSILNFFDRGADAMKYRHLLSQRAQDSLDKLSNITSLNRPAVQAAYNKTNSLMAEIGSSTDAIRAHDAAYRASQQAYVVAVLCNMTKQVYDGISKCEDKFVGKLGENIKQYTKDIVAGNNIWRKDSAKDAEAAISLCEKYDAYARIEGDRFEQDALDALLHFGQPMSYNYHDLVQTIATQMNDTETCYYPETGGVKSTEKTCYTLGNPPERVTDPEFHTKLSAALEAIDEFSGRNRTVAEFQEPTSVHAVTTPIVLEDFRFPTQYNQYRDRFEIEYKCLLIHGGGATMCTESAFGCLIQAH